MHKKINTLFNDSLCRWMFYFIGLCGYYQEQTEAVDEVFVCL
jgi:hypothetical protein